MKRDISTDNTGILFENWPGQFDAFSHVEFSCAIPQVLFLISTLKSNGAPNLCFHSWSCFGGDAGGYFVVMQNVAHSSHTYENIVRDGEFCINFVSPEYYPNCIATVQGNGMYDNEIQEGKFTEEKSLTIKPPRLKEAFMVLECKLACNVDLSRQNINSMIIGRVTHAAAEEKYLEGLDKRFGKEGFMFNIHEPADYGTGELDDTYVASLDVLCSYSEMRDKPFGTKIDTEKKSNPFLL